MDKDKLLKSIELSGGTDDLKIRQLVNENLSNVLDVSAGKQRIKPKSLNKFSLILERPASLNALSSTEVRCLCCNKVIAFPTWYCGLMFSVNLFHYFVCFRGGDKPVMHKD